MTSESFSSFSRTTLVASAQKSSPGPEPNSSLRALPLIRVLVAIVFLLNAGDRLRLACKLHLDGVFMLGSFTGTVGELRSRGEFDRAGEDWFLVVGCCSGVRGEHEIACGELVLPQEPPQRVGVRRLNG